jgi:hypothetical protein
MALTALESCSGAPHWDSLQPTVTAIKQALAAPTQTSSDKDLTQQDFGGDCDTPPEPWSAIWVAWNSEDGFTFWKHQNQAALWSAADSNEWPVQYAMQKAQPAPVHPVERIESINDTDSAYAYADGWNACVEHHKYIAKNAPEKGGAA